MPYILADDRPNFMNRIKRIDRFVMATGARLIETGDKSYYNSDLDVIYIAHGSTFKNDGAIPREHFYYRVLFHELAHWTSSKHRLRHLPEAEYGTVVYGIEEMVAEITASLLCVTFDITTLANHHERYLANWHRAFNNDQVIFEETVSPLAEQTLSYLLAFETK